MHGNISTGCWHDRLAHRRYCQQVIEISLKIAQANKSLPSQKKFPCLNSKRTQQKCHWKVNELNRNAQRILLLSPINSSSKLGSLENFQNASINQVTSSWWTISLFRVPISSFICSFLDNLSKIFASYLDLNFFFELWSFSSF